MLHEKKRGTDSITDSSQRNERKKWTLWISGDFEIREAAVEVMVYEFPVEESVDFARREDRAPGWVLVAGQSVRNACSFAVERRGELSIITADGRSA